MLHCSEFPLSGPRYLSPRRGVIPVSEKNRDDCYVSESQCVGKIFVDQGRDGPWGQEDDPDITDHWPAPATQSIGVNKL